MRLDRLLCPRWARKGIWRRGFGDLGPAASMIVCSLTVRDLVKIGVWKRKDLCIAFGDFLSRELGISGRAFFAVSRIRPSQNSINHDAE